MYKIITILFLLLSFAHTTEVSTTAQNIRAYPLAVKKASIKGNYNVISSGLDIFNIRDSNVGTASSHGSLGDLSGLDLSLGYGLYKHISFFYNFEYQQLDYAGETLKNRKNELYAKLNIYQNPTAIIDTFSTDIGLVHNSTDDLSIAGSSLGITQMDDMSDSSLYLRFLAGSKIRSTILDFYLGLKYTSINTTLDTLPHNRNEIALSGGFQYTMELGTFLIETGYEYIRLFNRDVDNVQKSNHVFNLMLSKALNEQLLIYIGSKLYLNQYNGVIPYLYNERTKNAFDQKFGYMSFGIVYNFDFDFDFNGLNNRW